jgi:hypothetical protein
MKNTLHPRPLAKSLLLSLLVALATLYGVGAGPGVAAVETSMPVDLFRSARSEGAMDYSDQRGIVRSRYVTLNTSLLVGSDGSALSLPPGATLSLNLFDDLGLTAVLERVELNAGGGFNWLGHVEGIPYSQVILVVNGEMVVGNVATPQGVYQVRYAGGGVHAVHEIDQSAFPDEMEPVRVDLPLDAPANPDEGIVADDGSVIDVLVVYTGAARVAAGGTAAMNSLVNLAVAETNQGYANSLVNQRLNLVHTTEVAYGETGDIFVDLTRLRDISDPYLSNVHSLRDTHAADEVVLIVENGGAYCGVAYLMAHVSATFASSAFAVVVRDCATGYYSFGHELGHNMGALHDWYVDNDTIPYAHAHGYVRRTSGWRTIMAYNSECSAFGVYCSRLPFWSNPDLTYGGVPMGVPEGTGSWCSTGIASPNCDADNRKTLNKTAYTVANFRQGARPPQAPENLTATATSPQSIRLSWSDRSQNEAGFEIERSSNGTTGWALIAAVAANIESYTDTELSPQSTRFYRIRAYNGEGDSPNSNVASATTPPIIVGPLVIQSLTIDDDNVGQSAGNNNGYINCGESFELHVNLYNQGNTAANSVLAAVSGTDPFVSLTYNASSGYPDVPPGGQAANGDDFDYSVDPDTPHGHLAQFQLQITAGNGGPWFQDLDLRVLCSANAPYRHYLPAIQR